MGKRVTPILNAVIGISSKKEADYSDSMLEAQQALGLNLDSSSHCVNVFGTE